MKRAALLAVTMILCLALAGCGSLQSKSQESLTRWVEENRETWEKAISTVRNGRGIRIDRELTDQWSKLFRDGRLSHISCTPEGSDCLLFFNGIGTVLEGDQYLVWSERPIGEIAPMFPDDPGTLKEKTDTRLYWTGIGSGGRGYILVERIAENWYYVEYSLPT